MLNSILYIVTLIGGGVLLYGTISFYFSRKVLNPRFMPTGKTIGKGMESGNITEELLSLPWQPVGFRVREFPRAGSAGGSQSANEPPASGEPEPGSILLKGFALPGSDPSRRDRTIIFSHGITWTRYGMFKYLEPFLKDGWNIFMYDHRRHGESEGRHPSFGFFEKYDLLAAEEKAFDLFPKTKVLGVFGESMGSTTILQYLPLSRRVSFAIADCPFSSLAEELFHRLSCMGIPKVFHQPLLRGASIAIRIRAGFDIGDVNPLAESRKSKVPLLLMHGGADTYVPTWMSEEIHGARKDMAPTRLCIIPEAEHGLSISQDRREYLSAVENFLREFRFF